MKIVAMAACRHLSFKERYKLYRFLQRHRCTIYREIKRNSSSEFYLPDTAHRRAQGRKHGRYRKIIPDTALYYYILNKLKKGWSPEQISGRMRLQKKPYYVCHETIYRYIYRGRKNNAWFQYLFRAKPRRGKRKGRKHGSGKFSFLHKLIEHRPKNIECRKEYGHWEGDTIAFSSSKYKNITTLVERKSRYLVMHKNENRKSSHVMKSIRKIIDAAKKKAFKTITFDQGSEFAHFRVLETKSACQTWYCQPHSPWQRGTNENTNGYWRRYLPRTLDIENCSNSKVQKICKNINNLPRKLLGYRTPKEVMKKDIGSFCRN